MISPEAQVLDINPFQWRRLFDALLPRRTQRILTLIHDRGQVLKAHDSERGLRPELRALRIGDPISMAEELLAAEEVDQVLILDQRAVDSYYATLQTLYDPYEDSDGYFQRARLALDHYPAGIVRHPSESRGLTLAGIPYEHLEALLAQVPDRHTLVLGVFEGPKIWASVILGVEGGKVTLVTTSDAILPLEIQIADWRSDYRQLLECPDPRYARPFAGLFLTTAAFQAMLISRDKLETLRRLLQQGEAIVDPCPTRWQSHLAGSPW